MRAWKLCSCKNIHCSWYCYQKQREEEEVGCEGSKLDVTMRSWLRGEMGGLGITIITLAVSATHQGHPASSVLAQLSAEGVHQKQRTRRFTQLKGLRTLDSLKSCKGWLKTQKFNLGHHNKLAPLPRTPPVGLPSQTEQEVKGVHMATTTETNEKRWPPSFLSLKTPPAPHKWSQIHLQLVRCVLEYFHTRAPSEWRRGRVQVASLWLREWLIQPWVLWCIFSLLLYSLVFFFLSPSLPH